MNERRLKAVLVVSSLLAAGAVAALAPAAAQQTGGGTGGFTVANGRNNAVANLVMPMAALAYGAYWLAAGLRYHWITVPHRVGHPYAIPLKRSAREEGGATGPTAGEPEGEEKGDEGK